MTGEAGDPALDSFAKQAMNDPEILGLVALGQTRPDWGEPWTKDVRERLRQEGALARPPAADGEDHHDHDQGEEKLTGRETHGRQ